MKLLAVSSLAAFALLPQFAQASPEEDSARADRHQARLEQIRATCAEYGFQAGTDAFAQCMQREAKAAEAAEQQRREQQARQWRQTQCMLGNPYMCDKPAPTIPITPPVSTNCTRDAMGGLHCVTQ